MHNSTPITPFIIGVAGGSGSGKTTVSSQIQRAVGTAQLAYVQHDNYYYDYSQLSLAERAQVNYDHPDSLETSLLIEHLQALRQGASACGIRSYLPARRLPSSRSRRSHTWAFLPSS